MDFLKARLTSLLHELDAGRTVLSDLEARRQQTEAAVFRIQGAVQLLRELIAEGEKAALEAGRKADFPPTLPPNDVA